MNSLKIIVLIVLTSISSYSFAQSDTVKNSIKYNSEQNFKDTSNLQTPRQAVFRSFILPGLGQAKNKKWWKVPLVPAGFVGIGLVFNFNQKYYKQTLSELQFRFANPKQTRDPEFPPQISNEQLIQAKDFYRRNRDLSIFGGVLFYGLVAIDAYVDARLARFDVSQNLSIKLKPSIYVPSLAMGNQIPLPIIKLSIDL